MSKYLLNRAQGLSLPVGCISSLPLERSASEPGTRWRSWTSPCFSLCSRGNVASFRRRWYEMAETVSVTEAQGFGNEETRYWLDISCLWPASVSGSGSVCREGKGISASFFFLKNKRPGSVSSEQRLRVDSVGIKQRGWVAHLTVFIPRTQFRPFIDNVWGMGTKLCVSCRLSPLSDTYSSVNGDHSRQDRSGLTGRK